jgi:uncharacterized membrane protein
MNNSESMAQVDSAPSTKERIKALDLARGVAMMFVVVIHVLEQVSSKAVKESLFGGLLNMGTALCAATMFMFLMGAGVGLSRTTTLKTGVKRGLQLIVLGYVLNILRGTIPTWVGLLTHQFTMEDLRPYSPLYVTIELDIFHFAGIALIILSIVKQVSSRWPVWLLIGCMALATCPFVFGRETGSSFVDYFVNVLWQTREYGHFPVFPWIAYPLFGMVFGHALKNTKTPGVFFAKSGFIGAMLCLCGGYMAYNYSDFSMEAWMAGDYNEGAVHPWIVLCETGVLLLSLSLYHSMAAHVRSNRIFDLLCFWSREVTIMYCIQWIVIGWIVIFITSYFGFAGTILCSALVFAATHYLGIGWLKLTAAQGKNKK